MAVIRPTEIDDLIRVHPEDVELRGVHFVDEEFTPTLAIKNQSEDRLVGELAVQSHFETTIGGTDTELMGKEFDIDLEPGETVRHTMRLVGAGGAETTAMMGSQRPEMVSPAEKTTR